MNISDLTRIHMEETRPGDQPGNETNLAFRFIFFNYFKQLMQQESKRRKHPNQRFFPPHILWIYNSHLHRNRRGEVCVPAAYRRVAGVASAPVCFT